MPTRCESVFSLQFLNEEDSFPGLLVHGGAFDRHADEAFGFGAREAARATRAEANGEGRFWRKAW